MERAQPMKTAHELLTKSFQLEEEAKNMCLSDLAESTEDPLAEAQLAALQAIASALMDCAAALNALAIQGR